MFVHPTTFGAVNQRRIALTRRFRTRSGTFGDYGTAGTNVTPTLGVVPVALVASVVGGLFGHHNEYPNGNPSDLALMDTLGKWAAGQVSPPAGITPDMALAFLRGIAAGQTLNSQPVWYAAGDTSNPVINWGEQNQGRAAERAYAGNLVNQIVNAHAAVAAAVASIPSSGVGGDISSAVNAVVNSLQQAAATGQIPAAPSHATVQASLFGGVSPVVLLGIGLALVLALRGRR